MFFLSILFETPPEIVDGEGKNPTLTETEVGRIFAIRALPINDEKQSGLLLRSDNVQCMNTTTKLITFNECGVGSQNW